MNYNKKHAFSLSTHQFRARHVQGVQVKCLRAGTAQTHLSLLHPTSGKEVYRSSVYHHSANPQWVLHNSLHPIHSLRDVIVQVWDTDRRILLIEHFVTLSALTYLGEKGTETQYETNTVLLVLNESLFYSKHGTYPDIGPNVVREESDIKKPFCTVKSADTRLSYGTKTVQDLHGMYKGVVEAQEMYSALQCEIVRHTHSASHGGYNNLHDLKCRVNCLRDKRTKFSESLNKESDKLKKLRELNSERLQKRSQLRKTLRELGNLLAEELDKIDWKIRYVVKSKSKLLKRQQAMLGQLSNVFHITQEDSCHKMMIFGLKIHSQDQISDKSQEEELGPALGYTAHLVSLISALFDVPLRFPVSPALSLSTIRDDITAKLDEKRVLPLYIKGKDRSYFSYGVFLLHRNIAQIRHHCGLRTEEIKEPLGNLSALMNSRLRDTISCHPPARLVSNDKIISRNRSSENFKKTHKRVRSAPIKFTVNIDVGHLEARPTFSNAPSEVSSWNSSYSLKMSEDQGQAASSVEDITLTACDDKPDDSPDLIDFNDEEDDEPGPSREDPSTTPPAEPHTPPAARSAWEESSSSSNMTSPESRNVTSPESSNVTSPESRNMTSPESRDVTSPESRNVTSPESSNVTSPESSDVTSPESHNMTSPESSNVTSPESRDVTSPESRDVTSGDDTLSSQNGTLSGSPNSSTLSRSSTLERVFARTPESSFKSYVRGSELWGMSEDGTGRAASFKSYRTKRVDTPARSSSESSNSTTESSDSRNTSCHTTPSRTEIRTQPPQYHITKRYMALDSPIIIHCTGTLPSNHRAPPTRTTNQRSSPHQPANRRSSPSQSTNQSPGEVTNELHVVTPDVCPEEVYSN